MPRKSLKEVPKENSIDQRFRGRWRRRFKSSSKSAFSTFELIKSSETWHFKAKGSELNFQVGGDREAAMDADGKQEGGGSLTFQKIWQGANIKGETKTIDCVVKISRQGPNLLVNDNDVCGDSGASLSGMYHRF